jgi:Mg2+ and Co2+ transporter CorA
MRAETMNVASSSVLTTEPVNSAGVVAAGAYVDGRRVANIAIEDAVSWRSKPGHVVWIGLHEPDMALLTSVQRQFELHDLAIEDADHAHQRPKIEQYGDALFIVARTAQLDGESIAFGETHLFVGEGYLVSVRHGPRRYLRHELQEHAGTAMGVRLFHRNRRDSDRVRGAVLAIPARGVVVTWIAEESPISY